MFEEIKKALDTKCYTNCGHGANESCICKVAIYFAELRKAEEKIKALNIIKKHFIIKFDEETELNGNVWGRLVSIQAKEDEGEWDTTATANLVDYKEEFAMLKGELENE